MKITAVKPFLVKAGPPGIDPTAGWPYLFVKVETDEGIYGIGETSAIRGWSIEGVIRHLQSLLVGQDPFRTEFLWQLVCIGYNFRKMARLAYG